MKVQREKILSFAFIIFLAAVLIWKIPSINWKEVASELKRAQLFFIFSSAMAIAAFWFVRGWILALILKTKVSFRTSPLLAIVFVGGMSDQLLPARGGYVVRWAMLQKFIRGQRGFLVSALVTQFAFEGFVLCAIFLGSTLASESIDRAAKNFPAAIFTMAFVMGGLALILAFLELIEKFLMRLKLLKLSPVKGIFEILRGVKKNPTVTAIWFVALSFQWFCQIVASHQIGQALGLSLHFNEIVLMLVVINLAIVIPLLPGNVGAMQISIVYILSQFQVPTAVALAYSILFNALQMFVPIVLGLPSLAFVPKQKKQEQHGKENYNPAEKSYSL